MDNASLVFVGVAVALIVLPPIAAVCVRVPWLPLLLFWALPVTKQWLVSYVPIARAIDVTLLAAVLVAATILLAGLNSRWRLGQLNWTLVGAHLGLATLMLLGYLWTSAPDYGLFKAERFLVFSTITLVGPMLLLSSAVEIRRFGLALAFFGAFLAVILLVAPSYEIGEAASQWEIRQTVLGANALAPAFVMAVAGGLILTGMGSEGKVTRLVTLLSIPLITLAIYRTGSRTMFFQLFLTWGVWVLITRNTSRWTYRIAAAGVAVVFPAMVQLLGESKGGGRIRALIADPWSALVGSERAWLWWQTLRLGGEHPLIGAGTGAFATEVLFVDERQFPHNLFLEAFAENGFLGFVLLFIIMLIPVIRYVGLHVMSRRMGRRSPVSDAWFAVMVGAVFSVMFHWDLADCRLTWFLFGIVVAAVEIERKALTTELSYWASMSQQASVPEYWGSPQYALRPQGNDSGPV